MRRRLLQRSVSHRGSSPQSQPGRCQPQSRTKLSLKPRLAELGSALGSGSASRVL